MNGILRSWLQSTVFPLKAFATLCISLTLLSPANAAEDAKGIYLLGSQSSMAGFVPPPGFYANSASFFYSGRASGSAANSVSLERVGKLGVSADISVKARSFVEVVSFLWVTPHKVFGGNLGLGVNIPFGSQNISVDIDALATLTLANGTTLTRGGRLGLQDDTFNVGDPLLTAFMGWHAGNWHWKVAGLLNIPVGAYDKNNLVNMGFNRWAGDLTGSVTWLDPKIGLETSLATGFTINGENPATNYKTGTEFHLEFAVMQHFSKSFAIGITGYHYNQVTGDSGRGAVLGSFRGRATALGLNANLNFQLGKLPVSTAFRWFHEFDVKNRLKGDSFFITAIIPLGAP